MDEQQQAEEKREMMRVLFAQALCQGKLSLIERLFAPDFRDHSTPDQAPGYAGVRDYFMEVRAAFPDLEVTLEEIIVEGEKVAVRTTWRGTHLGIYEGIAPTGKRVSRTLMQIFRIANGLIAEEWNEGAGLLDSLRQKEHS